MKLLYLTALVAISSGPAAAQSKPQDVIVGPWRISQEIPTACQIITQASKRLDFFAVVHQKTRRTFIVLDGRIWNLGENESLSGEISWDDWKTSVPIVFIAETLTRGTAIRAEVGKFPVPKNGEPNRISIRIPEIYLAADFEVGDRQAVPAIEDCIEQWDFPCASC